MPTIATGSKLEALEPEFKPLTAEEARQFSEKNPSVSPAKVVGIQALVGLGVALGAWGLTGKENVGWSAGYGALAVVIPAALFARGLARKMSLESPQARAMGAAFGFFLWEMVKMALTVAMLFAAPRLVANLSWPAMLVGLVVTMKVYWVALMLRPKRRT
jgi:ATP synthase protein I